MPLKADIDRGGRHVRSGPEAAPLFDHFVGLSEERCDENVMRDLLCSEGSEQPVLDWLHVKDPLVFNFFGGL